MSRIRVLIADDHPVFRYGLRALLQAEATLMELVLSPKTVRNHVSSIFSKLQVAGRAEAIIRARDAGLTKDMP